MNQSAENQTEIILNSIADGVFTVDTEWKITSFNTAAEKITSIKREDAIGNHCWEVFRANICEKGCVLRRTMETGKQIVNQPVYIVNAESERIPISISTAILKDKKGNVIGGAETFRDLSLVEELKKEISGQKTFQDIISKNKEMQRLFAMIEQVAESNTTILIEGQSGTGKELFAKAIHSLSHRKEGPIVTINCGSIPDTLLESELFGYKAGAFTDAKKDKPGRIALARGGTLFLDEIGDISSALQVRLLRVLQERVYEPLGSTKSEKADVRIVAATNKNLDELVRKGLFREDLYYRINVVRLTLPPLKERKEDIPLLVDRFVKKFSRLNGKDIHGITPETLSILMAHEFPGNIRELENIIEFASVICKDSYISIDHLPEHLQPDTEIKDGVINNEALRKGLPWETIERNFLSNALKKNRWNRKITAEQLGMHPTTLWRKINRLNIKLPEKDGRFKNK
ncbi:MAG: sigma 54-interacting transcriptional regulator [Deltaproteobacteria bacterium]|nr:sigma 54-interacting transcriptional regulator [Deltaproteobacteria bacterium]